MGKVRTRRKLMRLSKKKTCRQSKKKTRRQSKKKTRRHSKKKTRRQTRKKSRRQNNYVLDGGDGNAQLSIMARVLLRDAGGIMGLSYDFDNMDRVVPLPATRIRDIVNGMIEEELNRIETHPDFQQISSVGSEIKASIMRYTGSAYTSINRFNRFIAADTVYNRGPDGEYTTPYARGTVGYISQNINKAFDLVPPTEKELVVFRGVTYNNSYYNDLNGTPYSEIYDKTFISTTLKTSVANHFFHTLRTPEQEMGLRCCYLMINIPKGSRVIPLRTISLHPSESEILLKNSSYLKYMNSHILKDRHDNRAILHEYELISDDDADDQRFNDPINLQIEGNPTIDEIEEFMDDQNFHDVEEFEDAQELQQGGSKEKNVGFSYNSLFKNQRFKEINQNQINDIKEYITKYHNKVIKKEKYKESLKQILNWKSTKDKPLPRENIQTVIEKKLLPSLQQTQPVYQTLPTQPVYQTQLTNSVYQGKPVMAEQIMNKPIMAEPLKTVMAEPLKTVMTQPLLTDMVN